MANIVTEASRKHYDYVTTFLEMNGLDLNLDKEKLLIYTVVEKSKFFRVGSTEGVVVQELEISFALPYFVNLGLALPYFVDHAAGSAYDFPEFDCTCSSIDGDIKHIYPARDIRNKKSQSFTYSLRVKFNVDEYEYTSEDRDFSVLQSKIETLRSLVGTLIHGTNVNELGSYLDFYLEKYCMKDKLFICMEVPKYKFPEVSETKVKAGNEITGWRFYTEGGSRLVLGAIISKE